MRRIIALFCLLVALTATFGCKESGSFVDLPDGTRINVELAITPEEQQKGLMFREELQENTGMLFIQSEPRLTAFWMKNTLIPLDIIFIDENSKIINVERAVPCEQTACVTYPSKDKAKYVLEINAGESKTHNLKPNDPLIIYLP